MQGDCIAVSRAWWHPFIQDGGYVALQEAAAERQAAYACTDDADGLLRHDE